MEPSLDLGCDGLMRMMVASLGLDPTDPPMSCVHHDFSVPPDYTKRNGTHLNLAGNIRHNAFFELLRR